MALAKSIDYCLKPLIERFGDRPIAEIRTADIEDFIADLKKPRIVHRQKTPRTLTPASINRTFQLMRHMMNWAVGREYLKQPVAKMSDYDRMLYLALRRGLLLVRAQDVWLAEVDEFLNSGRLRDRHSKTR